MRRRAWHPGAKEQRRSREHADMRFNFFTGVVLGIATACGCTTSNPEMMGNLHRELSPESFYLPNVEASRVVSVATNGVVRANILVQTHRAAVKETGPKETVARACPQSGVFGRAPDAGPNDRAQAHWFSHFRAGVVRRSRSLKTPLLSG